MLELNNLLTLYSISLQGSQVIAYRLNFEQDDRAHCLYCYLEDENRL